MPDASLIECLYDYFPFFSSSLTGRDAAYTMHGYEVNIHPSPASGTGQVPSGSSKVRRERGERGYL